MATFALLDVVAPYVLGGDAIGQPWHELLSALFVTEIETSFDDNGVAISGIARFSADPSANQPLFTYTPPASITFAGAGAVNVDHRTARTDGAFWDFPDIAITFRLSAPRASSPVADLVVSGGGGGVPAPLADGGLRTVLAGLGQGQPAVGQPAADAPDTVFHLDLLIDAATLHLPFLTGALLKPDGMLAPDPLNPEVTVTLPKIKLSLEQTAGGVGGATDPQMVIGFDSWAAHDIDDPAGAGYGELITMKPPYALFGPDDVLGFGFASVILDLSSTSTPPDLLAKFGVGDDFRGIYLPDVRVFVKPPGLNGLGIDVSARELLIGLGPEGGVSGIFGLDIVKPDAPQSVSISIYDEFGGLVFMIRLPDVADPTQPAVLYATEIVALPAKTHWVVDVTGGQPPYNITIDGNVQTTEPIPITLTPGSGVREIPVNVTDVHVGGQSRPALVRVVQTGASLTAPDGRVAGGSKAATIVALTPGPPGFTITMLDAPQTETVEILFTPEAVSAATLTRGAVTAPLAVANGRTTVPLKHGDTIDVTAEWATAATGPSTPLSIDAQFQYAQPKEVPNKNPQDPDDPAWTAFAADPSRIRTVASKDDADPNGGWLAPDRFLIGSPGLAAFVAEAQKDPTVAITLTGSASKEHVPLIAFNLGLSQRRIWALRKLLAANGITNPIVEDPEGEQPPSDPYLKDGRGAFRKVSATILTGGSPGGTSTASVRIARPPRPPVPDKKKPPVVKREPAGNDSVRFKELHLRVEIDHNRLIAIELKLKIDVETALESYLSKVKQDNAGSVGSNGQGSTKLPVGKKADANDGVLDIRVQLTLDDTVGRWQVLASLFENDTDGLLQTPPPTAMVAGTASETYWRDFFGTMIAIAPLVDASASSNTAAGDVTALVVAAGIPLAAIALDIVHVPRITMYGGELTISHDAAGTRGALLLDVEVALVISLEVAGVTLIDTDPKNPITVRYKAVGFTTSDRPQIRDLVPVFDSSKGYTINIPSSGGIKVPDPLGDILQVAGTRISRSNPANLELDLELKADLGVVSVDKTTIRIPLEGGHAPSITALGVHVNVPGAIEGSGYLAIFPDGFGGQIDVSMPGLGVRVAAGLAVRHVTDPADSSRTATAVLITLEIDFPVPIALGSSGLGIYGFGGLFALQFRRDEHASDPVPALDWLIRVNGNPLDIAGWVPDIDHWAIGLGAVLGTMDAGFVMNVKGMIIFEMPGPRILLVMKAKIIWVRPPRQGNVTATILAVIDIDLGRGRITIGLTFDYDIRPLLSLHLPVRAIFPFDDLPHFAIDVGTWYQPAKVTFFEIFTARGYFMIRGKGIPDPPAPGSYDSGNEGTYPLTPLGGFAIATGVSVSFVWGSRPSGLYLSVGASVDVGLGFSPIMFTGVLRIWGELHLWIVGIEASAQLTVTAGQVPDGPAVHDPEYPGDPTKMIQPTKNLVLIDGEVHGEVDFFFFSISGSVHVTLGDQPDSPPEPPPLVTGVSLQSRAAALLAGVNSDRPIDGKLSDAHGDAAAIPATEAVPIDAIIVVHLDCTPRVNGGKFETSQPAGAVGVTIGVPVGPAAPAVRRGEPFYTYRIKKITLDHGLTDGEVPIVWWPNQPSPGAETKRELALLTRVPDPHPSAVEHTKHAEDLIVQHWADTCNAVAPPTTVLWTIHDAPLGPSAIGWMLFGTAWPDPPGSIRNSPVDLRLDVAETWRSGDPAADLALDVAPARVIGAGVACPAGCRPIGDPRERPDRRLERDVPMGTAARATLGRSSVLDVGLAIERRRPLSELDLDVLAANPIRSAVPVASTAGQLAGLLGVDTVVDADATDVGLPRMGVSRCWGRALEAPFVRFHDGETLRKHPLGDLLVQLMESAAAQARSTLDDVVAFRTHRIVEARFLLLVPRIVLETGSMLLRCFAQDGTVLGEFRIDGSSDPSIRVLQRDDLPKHWIDPDGPWHCRVDEVLALFQLASKGGREQLGEVILIDAAVPDGTYFVHLGLVDADGLTRQGLGRPSYLVGITETLTASEVERHHVETEMQSHNKSEIDGGLTAAPNPPALLLPNTEYALTVDWEFATCKEDGSDVNAWTDRAQVFRFRTDNQPLAPRTITPPGGGQPQVMPVRLDPWVLSTDPDEGERFYFHGSSIKVVFSVDYLLKMWDTYGVALQAKVRSASYRNSSPASPNFSQTLAQLDDSIVKPLLGSAVLTPWEGMVRDLSAELCVDASGDVIRQTILDVNLLLEPRTDYILDIEPVTVPTPPAGQSVSPLFRRSFATSRYADLDEMCADVASADLTEFPATTADLAGLLALASAPGPLSAAALDAALRTAGLRPVVEVPDPAIEVLWSEAGGVLQPRVLVIRSPEPLVRTRKEPETYEPPGQPRLQRKVITLVDKPYLEVIATPGVAGAPTMQVVSQPGLNTVVVLVDGGRNAPISLSVRRHDNPLLGEGTGSSVIGLVTMTLDGATWEVAG